MEQDRHPFATSIVVLALASLGAGLCACGAGQLFPMPGGGGNSPDNDPRNSPGLTSDPGMFGPMDVRYAAQPIPPPNLAMVLFVRPLIDNPELKVILYDHLDRFIVESRAGSFSAVLVYPADYTFVAYSENDAGVRAPLQAGHTYYVEVSASPGGKLPRAELVTLHRGSPRWEEIRTFVRSAWQSKVERHMGQAAINAQSGEVTSRTERVTAKLRQEVGDVRLQHLFQTSDGE